ncbi:MAG: 50S ribosomal protein L23 [Candidatus Moranbacteria bacterium]|nr:50S ribosomal protein L23 [Candidatus Moranbacteria bacterium]
MEKEKKPKKTSEEKSSSQKAKKVSRKSEKTVLVGHSGRTLASIVLRRPYVTEKSHSLAQKGVYVFEVDTNATKTMIRRSVEQLYEVSVVKVNISNKKSLRKRFGKSMGKTAGQKKAMITLKKGQTIEIFEGV